MLTKTRQEWLQLVQQQAQSGLSVAEFARQHCISAASLYARRSDFRQQGLLASPDEAKEPACSASRFVQVTQMQKTVVNEPARLVLEVGAAKLHLPSHTDVQQLVQIMAAFAP